MEDPASQVLAQRLRPHVPRTFAALAEQGNVPLSTLHHRHQGRRSKAAQAQLQQYLTPEEEKALVRFLLLMSSLGHPVRIKFIRSLAYSIARQRSTADRPIKPPYKNWPQAFQKRHPELKARRITHWFEVIGGVLQDPAIQLDPRSREVVGKEGYRVGAKGEGKCCALIEGLIQLLRHNTFLPLHMNQSCEKLCGRIQPIMQT
ncbi:hypothetical protein K469DRAFT_732021 [Zopfia rhizophila CBS 207.26]|uniref:HTH CENPB-type domain-containing protein n=1 Tax=Zopfia rhizophila CBS 207.26 TaxID=1314779 RepID=A0A6A6EIL0_9PEZI|nr:hypothetical protein K469DRAFT_732021 [Zopfia rhizophila CBS 207.26]